MRSSAAILLAGVSAFCQQAQPPLPEGVYRIGNGVTSPSLIGRTDPEYSREAKIAKMSGKVRISLVVGEDGMPRDIRVADSPGLGLEEKAIEAVSKWRFKPGLKGGMPVSVAVTVTVNFGLVRARGDSGWALSRAVFDPPEGATRPVLNRAPSPRAASALANGSVAISFDVDPNGIGANLHIESSSSPALESEVISIVRGWQFQPGMIDGKPVSVRCTLEFVEGNIQ
jgi:TonB family protein